MNLYRSWSFPLGSLVRANLLFWQTSDFYRPLPSVWYRSIYFFAGYHALPFHVANLLILAANIFLTYAVARRLSDSREVGALAALLGCYHTSFASLYFDTGFIYDVLCYFFFFAAFLVYLRTRQAGRPVWGWPLAATIALYICALNSKEMAVTLPLFLVIYELLYHRPRAWRAILALGAVTLVFVIGRAAGAESLIRNPAYAPVFTWQRFAETSRNFLGELFLVPNRVSAVVMLVLWAAMFAAAWITKSKTLRFAWLFLMLSAAPIAFASPRGAPQYYIPFFGWILYAAAALARYRAPLVFSAILLVCFPFYEIKGWSNVDSVRREGPLMRDIAVQLHTLDPRLPSGAKLFFLNDPIDPAWQNMVFIVRLSYGDDSLTVDRLKMMPSRPADTELAAYNCVFDYKGGRFIELSRPWLAAPAPTIVLTPQGADVYHTDWTPVAVGRTAAKPGEMLISRAIDLESAAVKIEVRVNGRRTDLGEFLAWPNEAGIFRVDFRVPPGTPRGPAKVEVTAGGVTGLPVYVPVAGP
jgi:hypothetical protein